MFELFKNIKEYATANYIPVIQDASAKVLFDTVKEHKPRRVLEIGTAVGYSGLIMLSAYAGARLHTVEIKRAYAAVASENFEKHGFGDRAKIFVGDAGEILYEPGGRFDFIFLDGPKTKYPVYYERLIELLNPGGILFADNILLGGRVTGETPTPKGKETITGGVRKYLELVTGDKRLETELIEIGDGIAISRKK